ncbi:hypothetical protein TSOC_011530 [Tetrabaena socialis]|uniref:Uncharacterized protein n=1 Tax=Tetrabaena socialis TaxID=47790 RepID=A0A2J7ZQE9_9CHLO|nr:hypothetical protein TSOC_011530 [Tetrabaena socialis]|eukprot:PNH02486.1 hypothetical protein TSOC_011530 [Tetrabaena socialis]
MSLYRLICSRKISRFLAMKSDMFSFSFRRSSVPTLDAASVPAGLVPFAGRSSRSNVRVSAVATACICAAKVVLSATPTVAAMSLLCSFRAFSSSLNLKISSSAGIAKGEESWPLPAIEFSIVAILEPATP